ncbi:manganese catalase family protein [Bacillus sp. USDA818B3_A]|uniref:manganese catalase family protein n=1 Tax=Bacillus sp. USDA818B3_A TaxID=2698834 RepID=UPI00136AF83D|nr:manganese catalase family protein [Bacillus sp. USDA818B3_A]
MVPNTFNREQEKQQVSYSFMNFSKGTESTNGRWAQSESMDGNAEFEYIENHVAMGQVPVLAPPPLHIHGNPPDSQIPPTP